MAMSGWISGLLATHTILLLFIFWLASENLGTDAQINYGCSPTYCAAFAKCPKLKCKGDNKFLLRNVTTCGCCHRCVDVLEENDECELEIFGNIPGRQCGPHLKCHKNSKGIGVCTKISSVVKSGCEYIKYLMDNNPSQNIISRPLPDCDEFGDYQARQCKSGTLCHCVDNDGNPIFGSALYTEADAMNCHCSRQFVNANRKLKEFGLSQLQPIHFMRCKSNGNFERFQYHDNYTYCINETIGQLLEHPVNYKYFSDLPCAKYRYKFETPCIADYNQAVENLVELKDSGLLLINYDLPQCDLDGSYSPVQCLNDRCFCVNKEGRQLKATSVDRGDTYFATSQQCTCARHLDMIRNITKRDKVTETFSRYQCDKNGNYLPLQCSNSACYCVDAITGYMDDSGSPSFAQKTETDVIERLFCYLNYPDRARLRPIFTSN